MLAGYFDMMPIYVTFHLLLVFELASTLFAGEFSRHFDLTNILMSSPVVPLQHLHPTLFTSNHLVKCLGFIALVDMLFV